MTIAVAAICRGRDLPFSIDHVELDVPRDDELLVRIVACGICHTDIAVRDGMLPIAMPIVLGHEGAGIVEAVGSSVSHVGVGDRVIMSFNSCGACPNCEDAHPTYCYGFRAYNWRGARPDGSATVRRAGKPLNASFFGQSAFATHAIATARNVIKVPDNATHVPLEQLAPLGCGLMTGAGAVLRSMSVRPGKPIAIFGTGTVGMAAIMAAKIAGANPIIAVDIHDERLALASELGATHRFNGRADAFARIEELCPRGLAYALDTTGVGSIIERAWAQLAPRGICGIVGASDPTDQLIFNETKFMGGGRRVMGILGGDSDIQGFLPELIDLHLAGQFPFERLIGYFEFEEINAAIHASESGGVIKPVVRIGSEASAL